MKLSELFRTPFKLKGGSTLNLKGFSKRVVDKEVGGGGQANNGFVNILFNRVQTNILPHPTKFVDSSYKVIDINDIIEGEGYYLLYKKSDIGSGISMAYHLFSYLGLSYNVSFHAIANASPSSSSYIIDGEEYVYLTSGGPA